MITYTKLKRDGDWGIRGPKDELIPGKKVQVTLKNGTQKEEQVGRVIWTGADKDTGAPIALAVLAEKAPNDNQPGGPRTKPQEPESIGASLFE